MKLLQLASIVILPLLFSSCSGSDVYRGAWKATDMSGRKAEIVFEEKQFRVSDSGGKQDYTYTQNLVRIENGVRTYGIQVSDGRKYHISFPNKEDQTRGLIKDENGMPVYTIGRNEYLKYDDMYKLQ